MGRNLTNDLGFTVHEISVPLTARRCIRYPEPCTLDLRGGSISVYIRRRSSFRVVHAQDAIPDEKGPTR